MDGYFVSALLFFAVPFLLLKAIGRKFVFFSLVDFRISSMLLLICSFIGMIPGVDFFSFILNDIC